MRVRECLILSPPFLPSPPGLLSHRLQPFPARRVRLTPGAGAGAGGPGGGCDWGEHPYGCLRGAFGRTVGGAAARRVRASGAEGAPWGAIGA